jgi:hypothetical protein
MERKSQYRIFTDRVRFLSLSPFVRTLFIDADTIVIGDVTPIFEYLDRSDFVIAEHANSPLVNCGVFAYTKVGQGWTLINHWRRLLEALPQDTADDQIVFNKEIIDGGYLDQNGIRLARMPWYRFNVKDDAIWQLAREGRIGDAAILHTHQWIRVLNELPLSNEFVDYVLKLDRAGDRLAQAAQRAKQAGDLSTATQLAYEACALHAANGHYKSVLADIFIALGQLDKALETMKLAVTLDPKHLMFNVKLANILAETGNRDQALSITQQCLSWSPDHEPAQALLRRLQAEPATAIST